MKISNKLGVGYRYVDQHVGKFCTLARNAHLEKSSIGVGDGL